MDADVELLQPGRLRSQQHRGPGQTYDAYQEIRGQHDLLIRPDDGIDLTRPGVERFVTGN